MAHQQSPALLPVQQTVTVSNFSRSPTRCFQDGTVAVTKRGKTIGYLLSPALFERGLALLAETEDPGALKEKMGLSDTWLQSVSSKPYP